MIGGDVCRRERNATQDYLQQWLWVVGQLGDGGEWSFGYES